MRQTNLLVICSDQHNPHIAGFMGNALACTPNLDRLAARGTVFEHAYTPTPICVPARAAMATGDYPFRGGFWDNAHPFCGDQMSWGRRLEEAGGQLMDWNFELRGAQSWICDETRWQYRDVNVRMPDREYHFSL